MPRAVGAERGRMFMDMQTDSLDIDALPNVSMGGGFLSDIDLSLALDAHAIRIARLGEAQVEGGSLSLKLTKQADDIRLDRLSIADLGGASVEASGASDAKGRWLSAKIDAARLRDFALLVRRVAPGPISDMLVDRSGALSPAKLTFNAQSSAPSKGVADATDTLTMQGTAGVTRVDAKLDSAADDPSILNATLSFDAPDAAPLLRQIGLPALSLAGQGRGHVSVSLHGRWGDDLDGDLSASLAGANFAWRGLLSPKALNADGALFKGAGNIKTVNAMPLLAVLGVAPPDSTVALPVDLSADIDVARQQVQFLAIAGRRRARAFCGKFDLFAYASATDSGSRGPGCGARPGCRGRQSRYARAATRRRTIDRPIAALRTDGAGAGRAAAGQIRRPMV